MHRFLRLLFPPKEDPRLAQVEEAVSQMKAQVGQLANRQDDLQRTMQELVERFGNE